MNLPLQWSNILRFFLFGSLRYKFFYNIPASLFCKEVYYIEFVILLDRWRNGIPLNISGIDSLRLYLVNDGGVSWTVDVNGNAIPLVEGLQVIDNIPFNSTSILYLQPSNASHISTGKFYTYIFRCVCDVKHRLCH